MADCEHQFGFLCSNGDDDFEWCIKCGAVRTTSDYGERQIYEPGKATLCSRSSSTLVIGITDEKVYSSHRIRPNRTEPNPFDVIDKMKQNAVPEITTDGRTVWVNAPLCVGRLCPESGEVMISYRLESWAGQSFADWKAKMKQYWSIDVPDKFRPEWDNG